MDYLQHNINLFTQTFNQKIEPPLRQHLAKVYATLASTTVAAGVGSIAQMSRVIDLHSVCLLGSLVLMISLYFYKDNGKNYNTRLGMLLGFGFCSGQALGPLLSFAVYVNPSILLTAMAGTVVTFGSLSLAAMFAERGKYLFLGGILALALSVMGIISLANLFLQIKFIQLAQLYIGFLVMAVVVLFDTQKIMEKCRQGNRDVIQHALDLFVDVLAMFRRLVIILVQKEERKREEKNKRH